MRRPLHHCMDVYGMTTVLLTAGDDWCALRRHRCWHYHRLVAAIRGRHLDQHLLSGADPDTSVLLSLRAAALISPSRRHRLALTLRRMASDAERSSHPFEARLPLARREILQARELIDETVDLLLCAGPANPMGVAHVQVLLEDGLSPLYRCDAPGALSDRLESAIAALADPHVITDAM
jgi:hypothetical protein